MLEDRLLDIVVGRQNVGFAGSGKAGGLGQCQILKGVVGQVEMLGLSCRQCGDIKESDVV